MSFAEAARGFEMVEPTFEGRHFTARRRVRLGDATSSGRLRLDAVARYLQDVSNDDTRDADWSDPHWWVVRRTVVDVRRFPRYLSEVDLATWCGGTGTHWAERRTRIAGLDGETLIDAAALWIHVDEATLAPSRVPEADAAVLAASAAGRRVGPRLLLRHEELGTPVRSVPWVLRSSDFDALGHMNNAAYWEVLEDLLTGGSMPRAGVRAVVEHVVQVEPGNDLVSSSATGDGLSLLLQVGPAVHAAAWVGLSRQ